MKPFSVAALSIFIFILCLTTGNILAAEKKVVVVYTALDQVFSEPILQEFERRYNIRVKAVYDIEAVKTTGLVNRLIAERKNPRCDVFWNNEPMRTIYLKRKNILTPYNSPAGRDIPGQFKDPEGYWAGFAARARVLIVNTDLVDEENFPRSFMELSGTKLQGKTAMANPLFGTTSTHVTALFATWGKEKIEKFLQQLLTSGTRIVDGNSVVRDMTGSGEVAFGITDTDDANVGIVSGMPIKMIFPDQDGEGTLLIPNTVALIAGAPHSEEGQLLIDFLLSREVETKLAHSDSAQIPLRLNIEVPEGQLAQSDIVIMQVDYEKMADVMEESVKAVQKLFIR